MKTWTTINNNKTFSFRHRCSLLLPVNTYQFMKELPLRSNSVWTSFLWRNVCQSDFTPKSACVLCKWSTSRRIEDSAVVIRVEWIDIFLPHWKICQMAVCIWQYSHTLPHMEISTLTCPFLHTAALWKYTHIQTHTCRLCLYAYMHKKCTWYQKTQTCTLSRILVVCLGWKSRMSSNKHIILSRFATAVLKK